MFETKHSEYFPHDPFPHPHFTSLSLGLPSSHRIFSMHPRQGQWKGGGGVEVEEEHGQRGSRMPLMTMHACMHTPPGQGCVAFEGAPRARPAGNPDA